MDFIIEAILNVEIICSQIFVNAQESDDEEDNELIEFELARLQRRIAKERNEPSRIKMFIEHTIANSTETEFQSHFRISLSAFDWLYNCIAPELQSARLSGRQMIDSKKQILAVLWLLATPDSYRSVGNRFDMGKSTLCACFVRVIRAINSLGPNVIVWPTGARSVQNQEKFYYMAKIRGVVGAIDGTYIPIKAPSVDPHLYINRKCFYGITLQCICDSTMKFIDCFTGYPSSVSDIRIFRNSDIYQEFVHHTNNYFKDNEFIIGDKAYPVNKWCIPPYIDRGHLARWQTKFNTAHAQTRQIIERSFALLFGRFRRLKYLDMNRTDLIPATIIAACILHNVCLSHPDNLLEFYEAEGRNFTVDSNDICQADIDNNTILLQEGHQLRDRIARNLR